MAKAKKTAQEEFAQEGARLSVITPEMLVMKPYPIAGHLMLEGKSSSDRRALAEAERYLDAIRSLARGE